jgi:Matrixin
MLAASLAAVSSVASGYAHWVFFSGRSGPFNPVPAVFNLAKLTNNTVSYFISDAGPSPLMPGDSEANIVSQIKAAANVWNQVPTSTIRVAFGGFSTVGTPQAVAQTTPGIDIVFENDVPPGLLAFTTLTFQSSDISNVANGGQFVSILRSTITLRKNLTTPFDLASYDDLFFVMTAHEFGHALGLQHTLTSAMMSTQVTSASTKAAPLAPDDIAGISLLYPTQNYLQSVGTIQGTVAVAGVGVNMANVVALSANGVAISTLSNPDGTYQIQGVPPGQYYIYASPLPPLQAGESYPDNIVPPQDPLGNPFNANTGFDTEFFGGTRDWSQSTTATVIAGAVAPGVNFNLQSRPGPAISYVETIGYAGQVPVYSPPLVAGSTGSRQIVLFGGPGIVTSKGALVPGLTITTVGVGAAAAVEPNSLTAYDGYGEIIVDAGQVQVMTPVALAVTIPGTAGDMYVLPYAFTVVPNAPPAISGVSGSTDAFGNTTVNVAGSNLNATTSVVFDGAPAPLISANSDGSLTVAAPPASAGYSAYVEALSTNGQTSWQDLGATVTPLAFTYSGSPSPSIILNTGILVPGTDSMLDISGVNTSFASGEVSVGVGSSDITVGQVWVLNSGRILANVTVGPNAQVSPVDLTVVSGLQVMRLPGGIQVQTPSPSQMSLRTPITNYFTGLNGTPAGGTALIPTVGVPLNLAGWTLQLDYSTSAPFQMGGAGVIIAQIPPNFPSGGASVQLIPPGNSPVIPPVAMQIDAPPPLIVAVTDSTGAPITSSNPAYLGGIVTLSVTGLTQSTTGAGLSQTQVTVGNPAVTITTPLTIVPGQQADSYQIQFVLGPNVPYGPQEPVTVGIGTRVSNALPPFVYLNILPVQQ